MHRLGVDDPGPPLFEKEIMQFDQEHEILLKRTVAENFTVLDRIDAHVFEPI